MLSRYGYTRISPRAITLTKRAGQAPRGTEGSTVARAAMAKEGHGNGLRPGAQRTARHLLTPSNACTYVHLMDLSLGVRALMSEVLRIAKTRGFGAARVESKVNFRGELVVALLIPARTPEEWGPPTPSGVNREAKRLEREKRG